MTGPSTTTKAPTKLFNRNYFLQWQGQSVSKIGSQVYTTAMILFIKDATGSATFVGLVAMLSALPAVFLGPVAGVLADRYSRRRIIILSDLLRGSFVLSLTLLLFFRPHDNNLIVPLLLVVATLSAIITSFFGPAISASTPDLVPHDKIPTANSLGQMATQVSVFIGQGLGAILYRTVGAPLLFLFNALSFYYASGSEVFVTIPQTFPERQKGWREEYGKFKLDLVEGLRYVWTVQGLRESVFAASVLGFFAAPVVILLPFFVEDFLKVKIDWYGFMVVSFTVGTMIGFLLAGLLRLEGRSRGRATLIFIMVQAAAYGLLGLTRAPYAALAVAALSGLAGGFVRVSMQAILQATIPSVIRGRVFGVLGTVEAALAPIAMGLAGIVADLLNKNIPLIYIGCGVIMFVLTVGLAFSRNFRAFLSQDITPAAPQPAPEAPAS